MSTEMVLTTETISPCHFSPTIHSHMGIKHQVTCLPFMHSLTATDMTLLSIHAWCMSTNMMLLFIHAHRYGAAVIAHTMNIHWNGVAIRDHQSLLFLTNSPFLHTVTSAHMMLPSRTTSHCYEQHFMRGIDVQ